MNKARTESKQTITTQAEADKAMIDLDWINSDLSSYTMREAKAIAKVREKFHEGLIAQDRELLETRKKAIERELKNFCKTEHKKWDGKSKETPGGMFGFRWSHAAVSLVKSIAKTFEEASLNVKLKYQRFNKRVDTLNKELMLQAYQDHTLDVDKLYNCGLKIEQKEKFFIKTHSSEALGKAREQLKNA